MSGGDTFLSGWFRWYGRKVASFPLVFMAFAMLFVGSLCVGMVFVTIDSDPDLIWVPPGSNTALQKKYFDAAFDPFFRINQVIISLDGDANNATTAAAWDASGTYVPGSSQPMDRRSFRALRDRMFPNHADAASQWVPGSERLSGEAPGVAECDRDTPTGRHLASGATAAPVGDEAYDEYAVGILTPRYWQAILSLQMALMGTADSAGTRLTDICYKPIVGEGCLVETPLDYVYSDAAILANLTTADIQDAIDCRKNTQIALKHSDYTPCFSTIHTPMLQSVVLGGITCLHAPVQGFTPSVCGGCGRYASAVMLTILLQASDEVAAMGAQWEQEVFLPLASSFAFPGLRVSYMAQRSVSDQIEVVDQQNQNVVVISYAIMFVYIALALGKFPHPVYTRASLGFQGIAIVALSVVAAIGLASWCGLHITMIVAEVVPFLILALGVDNMFIITQAYDRHWRKSGYRHVWEEREGIPDYSSTGNDGDDSQAAAASTHDDIGTGKKTLATRQYNRLGDEPSASASSGRVTAAASSGSGSNPQALPSAASASSATSQASPATPRPEPISTAAISQSSTVTPTGTGTVVYRLDPVPPSSPVTQARIVESVGEALAEVGPTIFAAAISEVLAFTMGATTDIPALQQFCVVAAIAVAVDFLLQIMWFAAAVSLDGRRQSAGRYDVICCKRTAGALPRYVPVGHVQVQGGNLASGGYTSGASGTDEAAFFGSASAVDTPNSRGMPLQSVASPSSGSASAPTVPLHLYTPAPTTDAAHQAAGSKSSKSPATGTTAAATGCWPSLVSCVSQAARNPRAYAKEQVYRGQYVRRACHACIAPTILSTPVRLAVIALWALFLGTSLYGATQLNLGLEQQLPLPRGSYLLQYFNDQAQLGDAGPPLYIVLQNVNYSHPDTPDKVQTLVETLAATSAWIDPPVASWVPQFVYWTSNTSRAFVSSGNTRTADCPVPLDPSVTPYAQCLAQFIYDIPITSNCCQQANYCAAQFSSDIKFLWGLPKNKNATSTGTGKGTASGEQQQGEEEEEEEGVGAGIDDGGCDIVDGYGYLTHADLATALSASASAGTGNGVDALASSMRLSPATVAALPASYRQRMARVAERRLGLATGAVSHEDAHILIRAVQHGIATPASLIDASASSLSNSGVWPCRTGDVNCTLSLVPCHVLTSRLRTQLTPLRNQSDFIAAMQHVQAAVNNLQQGIPTLDLSLYGLATPPPLDASGAGIPTGYPGTFVYNFSSDDEHSAWLPVAPGGNAFPYSLTFVYYEQYNYIRGVAVANLALAIGAVFMASYLVTSLPVAILTAFIVMCITLNIVGFVYITNPTSQSPFGEGPWGVDINAISVVNLVAAAGLSVEFCVHIASYFSHAKGTRYARAKRALIEMGASVFTGITLTKFVGVTVLAFAPSQLFRLYYFRMYLAIILFGAFHGLLFVPAVLSFIGWSSAANGVEAAQEDEFDALARLLAGKTHDGNAGSDDEEEDEATGVHSTRRLKNATITSPSRAGASGYVAPVAGAPSTPGATGNAAGGRPSTSLNL